MACRNPRVAVRITPASAPPTAKMAMSSTLMLPPNPFGPFSHAPKKDQQVALAGRSTGYPPNQGRQGYPGKEGRSAARRH